MIKSLVVKRIILNLVLVCGLSFPAYAEDAPIMPEELSHLAEANGCSQPRSFFIGRPGPIKPPYVYGVAKGAIEDSAVFWCVRVNEEGKKKYLLMFMVREVTGPSLAGKLDWLNPPMGLSIQEADCVMERNRFKPLTQKDAQTMPKSNRFEGRNIISSYDGVSETFVMKHGRWWVSQSH